MTLSAKRTLDADAQRKRMLDTPIPKIVTAMAIPSVLYQMVSLVYNLVDTYFVAQIGTSAAAAVGIAFSLVSVINALNFSITMGERALISRRMGAGDDEAAHRYASSAAALCLLISILVTALGLLFTEPILRFFGASPTMLPYAIPYCRVLMLGMVFYCTEGAFSAALMAQGMAGYAMSAFIIGSISNGILDYIFVIPCQMGAAGAALATSISSFINFSILVSAFLLKKSSVKIHPKYVSKKIKTYWNLLYNGMATFFRQGSASISSTLLNRITSPYGDAAVAAISIANKVYMLCRNLILGLGNGYQPVAGFNYGAGRKERVKKAFGFTCAAGTAVCLLSAAVIALFPDAIIRIFRDDADVIAIGSQMLRYMVLSLPVLGFSTCVNQTYQCLGFSLWASVLACCRQGILFVPCLYLLHHLFGLAGITMTQAAADIFTALVSVPFCIIFFQKLINKKRTLA